MPPPIIPIEDFSHSGGSIVGARTTLGGQPVIAFFSGKCILSNFYTTLIETSEGIFTSSEHVYTHARALYFEDEEAQREIKVADEPRDAKEWAKKVKGFDKERWDSVKDKAMASALLHKFTQCNMLQEGLLSTHPFLLVEASPGDRYWGIGRSLKDLATGNYVTQRGQNNLGLMLMSLRTMFRNMEHENLPVNDEMVDRLVKMTKE